MNSETLRNNDTDAEAFIAKVRDDKKIEDWTGVKNTKGISNKTQEAAFNDFAEYIESRPKEGVEPTEIIVSEQTEYEPTVQMDVELEYLQQVMTESNDAEHQNAALELFDEFAGKYNLSVSQKRALRTYLLSNRSNVVSGNNEPSVEFVAINNNLSEVHNKMGEDISEANEQANQPEKVIIEDADVEKDIPLEHGGKSEDLDIPTWLKRDVDSSNPIIISHEDLDEDAKVVNEEDLVIDSEGEPTIEGDNPTESEKKGLLKRAWGQVKDALLKAQVLTMGEINGYGYINDKSIDYEDTIGEQFYRNKKKAAILCLGALGLGITIIAMRKGIDIGSFHLGGGNKGDLARTYIDSQSGSTSLVDQHTTATTVAGHSGGIESVTPSSAGGGTEAMGTIQDKLHHATGRYPWNRFTEVFGSDAASDKIFQAVDKARAAGVQIIEHGSRSNYHNYWLEVVKESGQHTSKTSEVTDILSKFVS